jgi:hypothetical protein
MNAPQQQAFDLDSLPAKAAPEPAPLSDIPEPGTLVRVAGRRGWWGVFGTHGRGKQLSVQVRLRVGLDTQTGQDVFDPRSHYVRPGAVRQVPVPKKGRRQKGRG